MEGKSTSTSFSPEWWHSISSNPCLSKITLKIASDNLSAFHLTSNISKLEKVLHRVPKNPDNKYKGKSNIQWQKVGSDANWQFMKLKPLFHKWDWLENIGAMLLFPQGQFWQSDLIWLNTPPSWVILWVQCQLKWLCIFDIIQFLGHSYLLKSMNHQTLLNS